MMELAMMPPKSDSKISHQILLETLYNKNQLLTRIKREFTSSKEVNFVKYIQQIGLDVEFGLALLVQMVLHKRTTLPTLVGILRVHFKGPDASQHAANALRQAAEADLVDWSPTTQQFIVKFDITSDVQRELDKFQFPLPMITEPRELGDNRCSPYVICRDGSVILRNNHHDDDVCLDHLNRVNKIKFTLDNDTAKMIQNQWRNLDKAKPGETREDFAKRKRAFEKYDRTAKEVMGLVTELGNEFYLTHKYDKRGRVYCQGYHLTYQGNAWQKAVIQLAEKELIP